MAGAYHYMHGEQGFFDVDNEVDTIAKAAQKLEGITTDLSTILDDPEGIKYEQGLREVISMLREVTFVEKHIEMLERGRCEKCNDFLGNNGKCEDCEEDEEEENDDIMERDITPEEHAELFGKKHDDN